MTLPKCALDYPSIFLSSCLYVTNIIFCANKWLVSGQGPGWKSCLSRLPCSPLSDTKRDLQWPMTSDDVPEVDRHQGTGRPQALRVCLNELCRRTKLWQGQDNGPWCEGRQINHGRAASGIARSKSNLLWPVGTILTTRAPPIFTGNKLSWRSEKVTNCCCRCRYVRMFFSVKWPTKRQQLQS